MLNVLINGCNGKMGQEVAKRIKETEDIETLCGVDKIDTGDNPFPVFEKVEDINLIPDCIIDFSIPKATLKILDFSKKNKIPIVIATTGFSEDEDKIITEVSKEIPVFKSANMSYEINLMAKIVADISKNLSDSDIEIIETHHNRKIDSPSGTALILADSINEALDGKMNYEYDRHSKRERRSKNEIGIHSIRGGTEVGKHSVIFFGQNESFEITHNVISRSVFADGAIKAAKFLVNKDAGSYNMNDLFI